MKRILKSLVTILLGAGVVLLFILVLQNFGVAGNKTGPAGFVPPGVGPGAAPAGTPMSPVGLGAEASLTAGTSVSAVTVSTAVQGPIAEYIVLTGDVEARSSVNVVAPTSGKMTLSSLALGKVFKKDDVVAEVGPSSNSTQYAPVPIRAPIDGAITAIRSADGQTVTSGTSIATMSSVTDMQIVAYVPERYVGSVSIGSQALLGFEAYPGQLFLASVVEKSPILDPATRTMEIKLQPGIPDGRIQPGMLAKIQLITRQSSNAILVPQEAIFTSKGKSSVFVVEARTGNNTSSGAEVEGTAKQVTVTTGIQIDDIAEIKSGLNVGAQVIVRGASLLKDGEAVKVSEQMEVPIQPTTAVPEVVASEAVRGDIAEYMKTNGVIAARATVSVVPDIAGVVKNLAIKVGDRVEKNQVVATIDPSKPGSEYVPSSVKATIGGVVTSVSVQEGTSVTTSSAVATIVQLTNPQLKVDVPEAKAENIVVGQSAVFILDAHPRRQMAAEVVEISPSVDPITRSLQVTLDISDQSDNAYVLPGMSAQAWILVTSRTGIVKIPSSAIQRNSTSHFVYIIDRNEIARRTRIVPGLLTDSEAEIVSGLKAGDRIVAEGTAIVSDGRRVRIASQTRLTESSDSAFREVIR